MTRFKIKSFYSFTALAAIVPLIAMLLITLFISTGRKQNTRKPDGQCSGRHYQFLGRYTGRPPAGCSIINHQYGLPGFLQFQCFPPGSRRRQLRLETLKNALQAYPEVIGIFLYNTQSEETISHFAYTTLALYQERISEILKAETPENLRSYWRTESFMRSHLSS